MMRDEPKWVTDYNNHFTMPTLNRRKPEPLPRRDPFRWLYQSARWHRYSKQFLKENRLCVNCLKAGKTVIARVTDHIKSLMSGGSIWDKSNHQPLCFTCHSIKTKQENKQ